MKPKISIIVPVHNVSKYLSACIDSLISQTLSDIEIIAINDASTDNSLDILEEYAQQDARIKVINFLENKKTAAARNAGVEAAIGEYLAFVDGDDYIDLDFCEKLYNLATLEKSDIAKGETRIIDKKTIVSTDNRKVKINKYNFFGRLFTAIYRREMVMSYKIRFHIDFFCFQIQAVYYSNKISCCDGVYYNYVRHSADSCDSDIFSIEKWRRLNLGHANFIYDWINAHQYDDNVRLFYLEKVKSLYFYGYNKLALKDIPQATNILAETMLNNYDCGFCINNTNKLRRKLYHKNEKINLFKYLCYIISFKWKN